MHQNSASLFLRQRKCKRYRITKSANRTHSSKKTRGSSDECDGTVSGYQFLREENGHKWGKITADRQAAGAAEAMYASGRPIVGHFNGYYIIKHHSRHKQPSNCVTSFGTLALDRICARKGGQLSFCLFIKPKPPRRREEEQKLGAKVERRSCRGRQLQKGRGGVRRKIQPVASKVEANQQQRRTPLLVSIQNIPTSYIHLQTYVQWAKAQCRMLGKWGKLPITRDSEFILGV